MSLHVNLILDDERRSGSDVSLKFVLNTALIVAGTVLALVIVYLVMDARSAMREYAAEKSRQKEFQPLYQSVVKTRGELDKVQELVSLLEGWKTNRLNHSDCLRTLQQSVPANMQLTRLNMQNNLVGAGAEPYRSGGVYLRGRAAGQGADSDVRFLHSALKSRSPFDRVMEDIAIKRFAADAEQSGDDVRVFEMEGRLTKRNLLLKK